MYVTFIIVELPKTLLLNKTLEKCINFVLRSISEELKKKINFYMYTFVYTMSTHAHKSSARVPT